MEEDRITNLEIKLTHNEHTIEEMNKVLFEQQQILEQTRKALEAFIKRYKELEKATQDIGPADEKPPHY